MRTKTALLTAALVAAGVASSMAQSNVYSVNIVGYINVNVGVGYNLITLPLQNTDATSSINSVLTNSSSTSGYTPVPGSAQVITWNATNSGFNQPAFAGGDGNWYDATYTTLQTNGLAPGQGFFFYLPSAAAQAAAGDSPIVTNLTLTIVGSVLTGTNTYSVNKGLNFYGNFLPLSADVAASGFPIVDSSYLYTWNYAGQSYNPAVYGLGTNDSSLSGTNLTYGPGTNGVFTDPTFSFLETVQPAIANGFLYFYTGTNSGSWSQSFLVSQ